MKSRLSKNIKSKKHKKQSHLLKRTQRLRLDINKNKKIKQHGGASINMSMVIKYGKDTDGIQLSSGQMNIDFTENYNQNKLAKEPSISFNGLEQGKSYLLTMTDPDALGKTWTHWVAIINRDKNGNGNISKPELASYAPPSPPDKSGIHHYIFRLYDISNVSNVSNASNVSNLSSRRLLKKLEEASNAARGTYFNQVLEPFISKLDIKLEASYTVDSNRN